MLGRGYAHRWFYEWFRGPIPEGLHIDHLCRVRDCVNPAHLEAVPQGVNTLRGYGASGIHWRQTHCIHGHAFTEANTYRPPDRNARQCRECMRRRDRERYARRIAKKRTAA